MGLNVGFIVFGLAVGIVYVSGDCGVPPNIPNASHDWLGSTPIPEGTTVMYQCSTVYKPKLGADDATYVCSSAAWTDGNFECKQFTCGHIEPPTNGHVVNEVTYVAGSNMTFACNEGYTLSGTSTLICGTDGFWMPNYAPSCNIVSCPEFPDISHATTQLTYSINGVRTEYASVSKVMCIDGYSANGFPNVECQKSGQWTQLPICSEIICGRYIYPGLNSSCIHQIAWEERIELLYFLCNADHTSAAGPINVGVSCTDGGWSSELMACYCDCHVAADLSLVKLNNVDASGYIKHGQQLSWSCKNGGSKIITDDSELCNDGNITVPECQPAPSVITTQESTHTPTTTVPCYTYIQFATTTKEGETYKKLFCHLNVVPLCSYTLSWYTGSKEISRYSSNMTSVTLLDTTSGFNSSFSVIDEGLALVLVFPYTHSFNGKYVCMSKNENEDILSQAEYLFNNGLPEVPFIVVIVVIIIAAAVLGAIFVTLNSKDNSGADVEFGKDAGNDAEVAVSTHGKKIDAAGERAPMMST